MAKKKDGRVNNTSHNVIENTESLYQSVVDAIIHQHGLMALALQEAGISSTKFRRMMDENEEFADRVKEAKAQAVQAVELVGMKRGLEGVVKDVWFQGVVVGSEVQYSNDLLKWFVERHDKSVDKLVIDHTSSDGSMSPSSSYNFAPEQLTDDEQLALRALLAKAQRKSTNPSDGQISS